MSLQVVQVSAGSRRYARQTSQRNRIGVSARAHQEIFIEGVLRYAGDQQCNWSYITAPESLSLSVLDLVGWPGDGILAALNTPQEAACAASLSMPVVNISSALPRSPVPRSIVDNRAIGAAGGRSSRRQGVSGLRVLRPRRRAVFARPPGGVRRATVGQQATVATEFLVEADVRPGRQPVAAAAPGAGRVADAAAHAVRAVRGVGLSRAASARRLPADWAAGARADRGDRRRQRAGDLRARLSAAHERRAQRPARRLPRRGDARPADQRQAGVAGRATDTAACRSWSASRRPRLP